MTVRLERPDGVLFDLDGTLLDSAPDLIAALERFTHGLGVAMPDPGRVRAVVSAGGSAILRAAWPDASPERIAALLPDYLAIYAGMLAKQSTLFPGMGALLDALEGAGLRWGIVTNKIEALTLPLLEQLGLARRAGAVVCGDTLDRKKPDPAPLLHACARLAVPAARCVYVGDDRRDVEAARAARMRSIVVGWGYGVGEGPEHWGPDLLLQTPDELFAALGLQR